jgi:hypothetical protein
MSRLFANFSHSRILELVLDAQPELYPNEDLLAQSRTTQTINLIALYKALGGVLAIRHPAIERRIENSAVGIQWQRPFDSRGEL